MGFFDLTPKATRPGMPQNGINGRDVLRAAATALAYRNNPAAGQQAILAQRQGQLARSSQAQKLNATANWLEKNGMADLAEMARSGAAGQALQIGLQKIKAVKAQKPRRIVKAQDGRQYYADDKTLVIPDAKPKPPANGISIGPDGQLVYNAPKMTELKSKQVTFNQRMGKASEILDRLEGSGYTAPSLKDSIAREINNPLGNYAVSDQGREYVTAAREWISGVLRLDSGAAVPEQEFWRYFKTYFPQAGDDPKTIKTKKELRKNVEFAIRKGAGGTIEQIDKMYPDKPYIPSGQTKSGVKWSIE